MSDTQGTEWVQVEDWSTVAKGTRVKATRANGDELSFIARYMSTQHMGNIDGTVRLGNTEGWSLFIGKPKVQLPSEPGVYLDEGGAVWNLAAGVWSYRGVGVRQKDVNPDAIFTLLRPVAEVAAEIADWMDAAEWSWGTLNPVLTNAIRRQFGVTK